MKRFSVLLLAFSLIAATAAAQSLAEAARQEEARRKAIKAAGKVYTDKDLPKGAQPATSVPAPAAPAAAAAPATPEQPAAGQPDAKEGGQQEPAKDEAWWRARMAEARGKLARAQMQADAMQSHINGLTTDWANRDDPFQRQKLAQDRANALAELQRLKDEIAATNKTIADIQEEARRAGVPPGWLR